MGVADQLVKQGTVVDLSNVSAFNLQSQYVVKAGGRIDEVQSIEAIEASGLSEAQKDVEFQALERQLELERRQTAIEG